MKKTISFTILFISIFCSLTISAQKKEALFKMLIVTPDSALVDPELTPTLDLVVQDFRESFYKSNREIAASAGPSKSKKEIARLEWQFDVILNYEAKIADLKFYQLISKFACMFILERSKIRDRASVAEFTLDKGRKKALYDSLPYESKWQYLLKYKNLSAKRGNEAIFFSGTLSLFD